MNQRKIRWRITKAILSSILLRWRGETYLFWSESWIKREFSAGFLYQTNYHVVMAIWTETYRCCSDWYLWIEIRGIAVTFDNWNQFIVSFARYLWKNISQTLVLFQQCQVRKFDDLESFREQQWLPFVRLAWLIAKQNEPFLISLVQ